MTEQLTVLREWPPLHTFKVYFDGGGQNWYAYGSWEVEWNGFNKRVHRESYSNQHSTNNTAEYASLINALKWLQTVKDKKDYRVEMFGDSMLVVMQVKGAWGVGKPHLRPLRDQVLALLGGFGSWSIAWHRRTNSVARFGH